MDSFVHGSAVAAPLLAIDVETTGTEPTKDRVVEFSAISCDLAIAPLSSWTQRVNPGVPIPAEVVAVHGITDADVAACPTFAQVAPRLRALIGPETIVVAYNARFDLAFLHYEFVRADLPGIPVNQRRLDGFAIERKIFSHKLGEVYKRYVGKELDGAHGAEADNLAHIEVLRQQFEKHKLGAVCDNLDADYVEYLDWGRRFYKNEAGLTMFAFGKNRGRPAAQDHDYLLWMRRQDFPADVKEICLALLNGGLK